MIETERREGSQYVVFENLRAKIYGVTYRRFMRQNGGKMSRFKKNMASRILAYLLSGAMIMSNMTAYASEPSDNTGGGVL